MYSYEAVVKSIGQKVTLPAATGAGPLKDITNKFQKGNIQVIEAVTKIKTLAISNISLLLLFYIS